MLGSLQQGFLCFLRELGKQVKRMGEKCLDIVKAVFYDLGLAMLQRLPGSVREMFSIKWAKAVLEKID